MPITLTVNGVNYNYPKLGDENWGQDATNWAVGVTQLVNSIDTLINNTIISGIFELADATANTPALRFQNSLQTGIYRVSADTLGFSAAGVAAGQISSGGLLQWKDGSAAAPAFSFSADPDSGLSRLGANNIALSTGGVAAITIDSAQAVSLAGDLTVAGTTTLNSVIFQAVDKNLTLNLNGTDASAEGGGLTIFRSPSTSASIVFDSTKASLWKAGLVGSEVELVNISTAQTLSNKLFSQSLLNTTTNTYDIGSSSNRWKDLFISGSIDTIGILLVSDGSVTNPSYSFGLDTNTGLYRPAADTIGFAVGGTAGGAVDSTRKWTLGAVNDTVIHDIFGSAKLSSSASLGVTIDPLKSVSLSDNISSPTQAFALTASGNEHAVIHYSIVRGATMETGTMHLTHDGTNARVEAESAYLSDSGIDFTADISGANVRILYTSTATGSSATLRYFLFRWGN